MKVIVSGSEGFLGSHVCHILEEQGVQVVRLDISNGYDMSMPEAYENLPQADHFIHLANLVYVPMSYNKPYLYYRINYMTTLNALEYCRKNNAHLIYASSYIYGQPQYLPIDENHPTNPFNPYAQTKVICESLCEGYHRDFNVKVSILRPFNIYGVGQKGMLLIPEIIGQLKEGKKRIELKAASPRRDYVNVVDVAKAFVACIHDNNDYGVYNVCSGESVSVREITEIINKNLSEKVEFRFSESDRPNEVDETRGCCKKLEELGWSTSISFEEGIIAILNSENL